MDEKTIVKALLGTDSEIGNSLERTVGRLLKANFKLKLKNSAFVPDTKLIRADIFVPTEEYCRKFYRYEIERFDGGIDNFANYILSVKDKYLSYIVYLAESGGKRFWIDNDLNIVSEIYDKEVLTFEFDTQAVLSPYCTVCDKEKYRPLYFFEVRGIEITSDLMKQLVKTVEYYTESYGISDIETVVKCIRYQYDELFFGKTKDEILNMDFALLDMDTHTYFCLFRYGVRTIGEMLSLTDEDFSHVRNLGKKFTEEAKQIQKDVVDLLEFCKTGGDCSGKQNS